MIESGNIRKNQQDDEEESIDLKLIVGTVWRLRWWIAICAFVSLCSAFVLVRYIVPTYQSSSMILITSDKNSGTATELNMVQELTGMGQAGNIQNEKIIIKSIPILEKVVKEQNLNIKYNVMGRKFQWNEIYPSKEFILTYTSYEPEAMRYMTPITVEIGRASCRERV